MTREKSDSIEDRFSYCEHIKQRTFPMLYGHLRKFYRLRFEPPELILRFKYPVDDTTLLRWSMPAYIGKRAARG